MGISYNIGIPAATHNPSTDQPNMQTNNDNIATFVARDHVGFNPSIGTSGHHLQVTFDSNNVPGVFPVIPPVLFTSILSPSSLASLFFYSGDAAHSSLQYMNSVGPPVSGSTMLLGGIIVKWAYQTNSPGGDVFFPSAFPNACLLVVAASNDVGSATVANTYVYARNWTPSKVNILCVKRTTLAAVNSDFSFIAIGY